MIPSNATSKRDVQPLNAQSFTFVLPSNILQQSVPKNSQILNQGIGPEI